MEFKKQEAQPQQELLEEVKEQEREKSSQRTSGKKLIKVVLVSVAAVVLAACLGIVVYWGCIGVTDFDQGVESLKKLFTPRSNDVFYKESYSVSDEEIQEEKDQIVAKVADQTLTNGELQVYYWMNVLDFLENQGYYALYYGLDYTQPLDQQTHQDSGGTWQQHFLKQALTNYHHYQAMTLLALEEGVVTQAELEENRDTLRAGLAEAALEGGYASIDAMLQTDMGAGCTFEEYCSYMQVYYAGYTYFTEKYSQLDLTQEQLEAYFKDHEEELSQEGITKDSGNVMDVRHILVAVEGGTEDDQGEITYSEEEWETCRQEAQKLLDQWLEGEATEESFAQLAREHSDDTGSNENGGLYENLNTQSGFVPEFMDWYMEESRQPGDYELVQTEYGYHIMYFSGSEPQWLSAAREGLLTEESKKILSTAVERYPMEVTYKEIALAVVDFSQE